VLLLLLLHSHNVRFSCSNPCLYCICSLDDDSTKQIFLEKALEGSLSNTTDWRNPTLSRDWAVRVLSEAQDVGDQVMESLVVKKKKKENEEESVEDEGRVAVDNRLKSLSKALLCLSSFKETTDMDYSPAAMVATIVEDELLTVPDLPPAIISAPPVDDLYTQVQTARENAVQDLKEAFSLLKAELAVASINNELNATKN
jgi:hypothetical protein